MGPVTVPTERDSNISQMTHQTQDCDSECGRKQPSHMLAEVLSANQPQNRADLLASHHQLWVCWVRLQGVRTKCNQIYSLTDLLLLLFSLPFYR